MDIKNVDLVIVGAGPVGLMCAYLGGLCGLSFVILDKTDAPLEIGRADALNARTLQLLDVVNLFDELYPLGKICKTSSVWANGKFLSRQSSWWDEIEGCFHKHFLMLGQSYVEKLLDKKLKEMNSSVRRSTSVENIELNQEGCLTTFSNSEQIQSKYIIGADGAHSFVRSHFKIPFPMIRPQLTWAVIDGVIKTDFLKVPEIIVFQAETSDVAWIPREGNLDRFYVRMDTKKFDLSDVVKKINRAMAPHTLTFEEVIWFSQFSVKESVADDFIVHDRIFLAGDACHIHSVNGGQGLNTGIGDAFNLMWKLNMVMKHGHPPGFLNSFEYERKPVAQSVIEASGELVRSTKFSNGGTHAQDYVKIVEKRAGNITGMGIRYAGSGLIGSRFYDFRVYEGTIQKRFYSLLNYAKYTLVIFSDDKMKLIIPEFIQIIQVYSSPNKGEYWADSPPYLDHAILVRPDSYIEATSTSNKAQKLVENFLRFLEATIE